ncbi:hypothetical protein [Dactylosporangium sp. NPDC000521]|uniref:hypothetical protein n=1 Tax=Dactylosporangium sp. NPDC000521 TaxID=3363975 RepID=UPI0036B77A12
MVRFEGRDHCMGTAVVEVLGRLCIDATRALSASGAGVSVITDGGVHGMAVSSDAGAAQIEDLQSKLRRPPAMFHRTACLPAPTRLLTADRQSSSSRGCADVDGCRVKPRW